MYLMTVNHTILVKQAGHFKKDTKNMLKQSLIKASLSMLTINENVYIKIRK